MMASPHWEKNQYFGLTKEEIKEKFEANGVVAREEGNKLHKDIEEYYNDVEVDNDSKEF